MPLMRAASGKRRDANSAGARDIPIFRSLMKLDIERRSLAEAKCRDCRVCVPALSIHRVRANIPLAYNKATWLRRFRCRLTLGVTMNPFDKIDDPRRRMLIEALTAGFFAW